MSFFAREVSRYEGSPVTLLEVAYGPNYSRYTNQADKIELGPHSYAPFPFQIHKASQSQTALATREITAAGGFPPAQLFRAQPPFSAVSIIALELHATDSAMETRRIFTGEIVNVSWSNSGAEVTLSCDPITRAKKRFGLRRTFGVSCPHPVYRPGCNLTAESFKSTITSFSVSGSTVTSSQLAGFAAANHFGGGYIEYTNPVTAVMERCFIRSHDNITGQIRLNFPPSGLSGATQFFAYPGCDHQYSTCNLKFNNLPNYGGQPLWPTENPFVTTLF